MWSPHPRHLSLVSDASFCPIAPELAPTAIEQACERLCRRLPRSSSLIDRINHTNLEGLLALMSDDHALQVLDEPPVSGKPALRPAWSAYFGAFPDYVVYPQQIAANGDSVAVLGYTTGSHLNLADAEEARIPVLWTAEVRDGLLTRWSIVQDSPEMRQKLGLG